ncbi:hypothetical protein T484DRAFT_1767372, partial [Baffinella frigidus]
CHIGGTTLHAFSGIGLGQSPVEKLKTSLSKVAKDRWEKTRVIIVDEVSMLDVEIFDKLDEVAQWVRRSDAPRS